MAETKIWVRRPAYVEVPGESEAASKDPAVEVERMIARIEDDLRTAEIALNGIRVDLCEVRVALNLPYVQRRVK